MKLQETDWNHPAGATLVPVEFPDEPIRLFVNWLWTTKQWFENPEMVYRKFCQLREELMAWKAAHPQGVTPTEDSQPTEEWLRQTIKDTPGFVALFEQIVKEERDKRAKVNRLAALERARAARAAKRETVGA